MSAPEPLDVPRFREALARLADEPGWPAADNEQLFSALHGDMSPEERRGVVDELIRNPQAAAAWRLARELEPEEPMPVSALPWKWMSIAATLAVIAGAAWLFLPWRSETPVFRGGEPRTIASLLPGGEPLSRSEPLLRWTALEGARYRVRVLTPELALLDETEDLVQPEYRLREDVMGTIPAGGLILWQVEARVRGTPTVVSLTFSTQVE
jgi:hypothetical protein